MKAWVGMAAAVALLAGCIGVEPRQEPLLYGERWVDLRCEGGPVTTGEPVVVKTVVFHFTPDNVTVRAGSEVAFLSCSSRDTLDQHDLHFVTAGPVPQHTGLPPRDVTLVRFDEPGTYWYYCDEHSDPRPDGGVPAPMNGVVHVVP